MSKFDIDVPSGEYFNEETHEYFIDNVKYPSVTDIAKPISFERLNALQQNLLERARLRGEKVHEYCEEYLLCGEVDESTIESEYLPYLASFIEWARTYRPKVIYTEKRLFCRDLGYCGTFDLLCEIDGKIVLVDYKATSNIDKKSLSVQLAGYRHLILNCLGISIDEFMVLHLKKNGYVFKAIEPNFVWFDLLKEHAKFMEKKEK